MYFYAMQIMDDVYLKKKRGLCLIRRRKDKPRSSVCLINNSVTFLMVSIGRYNTVVIYVKKKRVLQVNKYLEHYFIFKCFM